MKGKGGHIRRLKRLQKVAEHAAKVVYVGADMIRSTAFQSISRGSVSGKNHVPSKPGEPPNRDTGTLQNHLILTQKSPLEAEVRSFIEYASDLEYGTSKMAARPYMRPARASEEPKIQRLFAQEINKLNKRSGR